MLAIKLNCLVYQQIGRFHKRTRYISAHQTFNAVHDATSQRIDKNQTANRKTPQSTLSCSSNALLEITVTKTKQTKIPHRCPYNFNRYIQVESEPQLDLTRNITWSTLMSGESITAARLESWTSSGLLMSYDHRPMR